MRILLIVLLVLGVVGCNRYSFDHHLNSAYEAYDRGECEAAILSLSKAERNSRSRRYMQPEISLLRGQCLERQALFVDAMQTYQFILTHYPASEYAYRARARMETLRELGHEGVGVAAKVTAVKP
ncbi:tetratricopeptide repeat protein [Pseudomonas leptonychotis]|uniref:Tetratricopeptide repeat protein n=1 Tax=Pseudomonas leptonychotis TaxID=2448482 RepID=A0A4T1ZVV4_9PSED|nr:tetratricopeptide repeat protein [Pseudomonas leptonychotis]TIH07448.1 tetratricopeptide repeat protein [Pseudomonas leptonychotis]